MRQSRPSEVQYSIMSVCVCVSVCVRACVCVRNLQSITWSSPRWPYGNFPVCSCNDDNCCLCVSVPAGQCLCVTLSHCNSVSHILLTSSISSFPSDWDFLAGVSQSSAAFGKHCESTPAAASRLPCAPLNTYSTGNMHSHTHAHTQHWEALPHRHALWLIMALV